MAVTPRRVRAGRSSRLRIRVTANGRAVPGATVRVAGQRLKTNRSGRTQVSVLPRRRGTMSLRASKRGMRAARANVRVVGGPGTVSLTG
jgi:hypothetical protein